MIVIFIYIYIYNNLLNIIYKSGFLLTLFSMLSHIIIVFDNHVNFFSDFQNFMFLIQILGAEATVHLNFSWSWGRIYDR